MTHVHDAERITPPESVESVESDAGSDNCDEFMDVEDTKHRIYVSNLEHEIREIEKEEKKKKKNLLLPGIEKLVCNPRSLYIKPPEPPGNELVLYRVPASISIPEEHDSVKRALSDARDRAAKRLVESGRKQSELEASQKNDEKEPANEVPLSPDIVDDDESMESSDYDAMDLDDDF